MAGSRPTLAGPVLAAEDGGDSLHETACRLSPADAGDLDDRLEIGGRVIVRGTVDHDPGEAEPPELDAIDICPW